MATYSPPPTLSPLHFLFDVRSDATTNPTIEQNAPKPGIVFFVDGRSGCSSVVVVVEDTESAGFSVVVVVTPVDSSTMHVPLLTTTVPIG